MFTSGSPNAGQLQIGIALVLNDRFSNQAREASSAIRRLHQEAKVATNANLSAVKNIAGAGAAVGTAMMGGLGKAIGVSADFIDTMVQVGAIARKDTVTLDELYSLAQSLGEATMFDSRDIASGMQYFAQAGMTTKEIKQNIGAAANLAAATRTELGGKGGAADLMTNIMKTFKIQSSEVNSARVTDILTTATTRSNTSFQDLAESIKYSGSTLVNLNGSLEQAAAFMGVLGDAGIQGSMAGTAVANTYRYLTKSIGDPDFRGGKALRALGLGKQDFTDAQGRLIDIGDALMKINQATSGMDDISRYNALVDILGVRGERGGTAMIRAFDKYRTLLDEIQNASQGRAAGIMEQRMESLKGGIDRVTSSIENLQTTYGKVLEPVVVPALDIISSSIESLRKILGIPVLGTVVSTVFTLAVGVATVRMGIWALRAAWRLTFNDSLVSLKNMFMVMTQGWRGASISAEQYMATEAAINAQRNSGIVSNLTGMRAAAMARRASFTAAGAQALMNNPGVWVAGGARYNANSNTFWMRNAQGGIRRTTAARAAAAAGRGVQMAEGAMVGGAAAGLFSRAGSLAKVGSKLLGFISGPWGIGLSIALPMIVSGISSLVAANRDNTDAVKSATQLQREKEAEERRKNRGLTNEEQMVLMIQSLQALVENTKRKPQYTVVIQMDGKEAIKKIVKSTMQEEVINVTGK